MIGSNLHVSTRRFGSTIRGGGEETRLGRRFATIGLRIVASLLVILAVVAEGSSARARAMRTRAAERGPIQERLRNIYADLRYPGLRREYNDALRKALRGDHANGLDALRNSINGLDAERQDPSDFIRFFDERTKPKLIAPKTTEGEKFELREPSPTGSFLGSWRRFREFPYSRVFADSFFDFYPADKEPVSNVVIIDLQHGIWGKIYIDVYARSSREKKHYEYKDTSEMLASFPKEMKGQPALGKATAVVSIGDSTQKELFKALGLPVMRIVSKNLNGIANIGPRWEACREKLSRMDGENTIFLEGLPVDEAGLKNLGKGVKDLKDWQKAAKSIHELIAEKKSVALEANARTFKEALVRSDGRNVVYVIAHAERGSIKFPDGSQITAQDIESWEDRTPGKVTRPPATPDEPPITVEDTYGNRPLVVFLVCGTADTHPNQPGEIVEALMRMGYIAGAIPVQGRIRPDEIGKPIDELFRHEDPSSDKLVPLTVGKLPQRGIEGA